MTKALDLCDIQGNVVRAYGRFGFPIARYLLLNISEGVGGRRWLTNIIPHITNSATWSSEPDGVVRPKATLNIAFNHAGLAALELPLESLNSFVIVTCQVKQYAQHGQNICVVRIGTSRFHKQPSDLSLSSATPCSNICRTHTSPCNVLWLSIDPPYSFSYSETDCSSDRIDPV